MNLLLIVLIYNGKAGFPFTQAIMNVTLIFIPPFLLFSTHNYGADFIMLNFYPLTCVYSNHWSFHYPLFGWSSFVTGKFFH